MPRTPLHALLWSQDQSRYELYTQQQLEQTFEPADAGAWLIWLENATAFTFRGLAGVSMSTWRPANVGDTIGMPTTRTGSAPASAILDGRRRSPLHAWKRQHTPFARTPHPPLQDLSLSRNQAV